jgi:hypothetical protein
MPREGDRAPGGKFSWLACADKRTPRIGSGTRETNVGRTSRRPVDYIQQMKVTPLSSGLAPVFTPLIAR